MKGIASKALAIAALSGVVFTGVTVNNAHAATATATMSISASVAGTCSVGGSSLAFGAYTPTADSTATSTIAVTCSTGTNPTVSLAQGINNNRASAFGTRALNNGTNYLGYDIYTDTGHTTIWNATNTVPVTSTGSAVNVTAYGRIPSGQNPATGSYNDTVTITVTF
jgi:spore coat protein U domain-containing protein, fimbrial subunit CupE1/2/3/6